jgi:hypothetical protein
MRKTISGLCPCGYGFFVLGNEMEAIVALRVHIEKMHKDLLPFGLTDLEARKLLTIHKSAILKKREKPIDIDKTREISNKRAG